MSLRATIDRGSSIHVRGVVAGFGFQDREEIIDSVNAIEAHARSVVLDNADVSVVVRPSSRQNLPAYGIVAIVHDAAVKNTRYGLLDQIERNDEPFLWHDRTAEHHLYL